MKHNRSRTKAALFASAALLILSACEDANLGNIGPGINRVRHNPVVTAPRPQPDARGVISYPNYQVVVARRGDTIGDLAARIGLTTAELAKHNGLPVEYVLREGELLALPRRIAAGSSVDIASIAGNAIDRADPDETSNTAPAPTFTPGIEPIRHRVERGETAYSIARLYDVSITSLSSWNGLGRDLAVREGQYLLIPVVESRGPVDDYSDPGTGTATPTPPSASTPLPGDVKTATLPASPKLDQFKTPTDSQKFMMPVQGKIISPYSGKRGGNEGIDIAATEGTAVKAADDGSIALISKSVGQNTIVLIRHADNIYTVYSNVKDVTLTKGAKVKRGQRIGAVAGGSPSFLHFEVRRGTQSVDPTPFL